MKRLRERIFIGGCALILLTVLFSLAPRPQIPVLKSQRNSMENLSLLGKIICVDPGHGGLDGGTRGQETLVLEREINLQVAFRVKECLEKMGAQVVMTRKDENTFSDQKRKDLEQRLLLAKDADMLLSIHMNEFRDRKESGPQVFYRKGQEESRLLAAILQEQLIDRVHPEKKREAMAGDFFILSLPIPSVLVECGFLSNAAEERKLLDENYQKELAKAICQGVNEYFFMIKNHF